MNKKTLKYKRPFYSFLDKQDKNTCKDTFYNPDNFDWVKHIEHNYETIKNEVLNYLHNNNGELKPYFASEMMNKPAGWKVLSFLFWGKIMSKNAIQACPNTLKVLNNIPGLVSASISITEAYSEIKPHYGDTDAIYRCHMGIEIPAQLPYCGFRVGYEDRAWQEGKIFIFNDANYHRGWNYTDKRRIILLFDVIKQEHIHNKKWICSMVLGSIVFMTINEKFKFFKRTNYKILRPVYYVLSTFLYIIRYIFFIIYKLKPVFAIVCF